MKNKELSPEKRKFAEENHNLIYSFLNGKGLNIEEYYDIAALAFTKAVAAFDDNRGISFSTFAYRCMQNELYMQYRKDNRRIDTVSLDAEIESLDGISMLDAVVGEDNMEENVIEALNISEGLTKLYTSELKIFKYRVIGLKHKEIAEKMNLSRPNVSRILSKNIKMILENKPISVQRKNALAKIDDNEASIRNELCKEILEAIYENKL